MVSEATARSASWEQTAGHDALHHVDVCPVVDVFAVRPLKVRNGGHIERCGHVRELVAAVRRVSLQGAKVARATVVEPGLLCAPVEAESLRPDVLAAPKLFLERVDAQVASALERAAEAELSVAESADNLPLQVLTGAHPLSPSAVRRLSATARRLVTARRAAAAIPIAGAPVRSAPGRLTAATLGCRLAARGTAAAAPRPRGAMAIAALLATFLTLCPPRETSHGSRD